MEQWVICGPTELFLVPASSPQRLDYIEYKGMRPFKVIKSCFPEWAVLGGVLAAGWPENCVLSCYVKCRLFIFQE